MVRLLSLFFVTLVLPCSFSQNLATFPELIQGESIIAVEVHENETSASAYCTSGSGEVNWWVNNTLVQFNSSTGEGLGDYQFLVASNDDGMRSNLTVSFNFSDPAVRFEVQCSGDNETATFVLGMRTPPRLKTPQTTYIVQEGDSFYLNLRDASPFPPYDYPGFTLTWLLNDTMINDSRIVLGDYDISIDSVKRNLHESMFTLVANTSVSHLSRSFSILVHFPTEAQTIINNTMVYQEVGKEAELIATDGLAGRPSPTFQWFNPNGGEVVPSTNNRFNFATNGRLSISNLLESDFGTYTYSASNGVGSALVVVVTLVKAIPPSKPLNVSVTMVMDEAAVVTWSPPTNLGAPPLSKYTLQHYPNPENVLFETLANSTWYQLTGLTPGISYTVNVTSVSNFDFTNASPGTSDVVSFKTNLGIPRISTDTSIKISDGKLILVLTLEHTGGYDTGEVDIGVDCGRVGSFQLPTESETLGSGQYYQADTEFENECIGDCFSGQELMKEISLGNQVLMAGVSYICAVTAQNIEGTFYYNTTSVIAITGIPLEPTVSVTVDAGSITVSIMSPYPGVSQNDFSFNFTIIILDSDTNEVYREVFNTTTDRIVVIQLEIGSYTVQVFSQNKYGTSGTAISLANVQMAAPSASPTQDIEEDDQFPLAAIVGIAVGGTVLIFIVFIIISILVICLVKYKRSRDSMDFYHSKYEMTIKRY